MKILKFGGSSVANKERIDQVVSILKSYKDKSEQISVVFSAFGGVTNLLLEMASLAASGDQSYLEKLELFKQRHYEVVEAGLRGDYLVECKKAVDDGVGELSNLLNGIFLIREFSKRTSDYVVSFGERHSAYIIAHFLNQQGIEAEYLDARKVIKTDENFTKATVNFEETNKNIQAHYEGRTAYQIVTGFIGSTMEGVTSTLGRGGSDYTAAILGAALDASEIEIWTDVDGVMTSDPRKVKKAFTIPNLSYAEAMEMSHFGAKVIYPPTIHPAMSQSIPLRIRNTFNPEFEGTFITNEIVEDDYPIRGISSTSDIALLTLQGSGMVGVSGIAARLFSALADKNVNIILITQGSSEHSISFAVLPEHIEVANEVVNQAFQHEMQSEIIDPLKIEKDKAVIAVIGEQMRNHKGIAGKVFRSLGNNGINVIAIAQGSSELNISLVIDKKDESKALNSIHDGFFLSDSKSVHLFIVGVGLIGKTLIKQINEGKQGLKERGLDLKVVGLANTRKMIFDVDGIDLNNWDNLLNDSDLSSDLEQYIDKMASMNLQNAIFVDNTASDTVAKYYEQILLNSISISTPNKIATSSAYFQYQKLKALAVRQNVKFMYETNVGAGLPVISTLNDLMASGDTILKIEGVLSGSLSFIFNTFKAGIKFSDVVEEAGRLGYTEPDPRIDLSGKDVARKILILARESGLSLEASDIQIENILPQACLDAPDVDTFFTALKANNDFFTAKVNEAEAAGKVLRFVASLEGEEAKIKLLQVDDSNPFYSLNGSDNMIVFTTKRYKERPLVVRGPGAGAEVTAAGVFAEIITIANHLS